MVRLRDLKVSAVTEGLLVGWPAADRVHDDAGGDR
jgi:hypothetical protein